jgi:hypothetical protein
MFRYKCVWFKATCHPAKHVPGRVPELEKKHWERCIKSGGEYFEGDKFD